MEAAILLNVLLFVAAGKFETLLVDAFPDERRAQLTDEFICGYRRYEDDCVLCHCNSLGDNKPHCTAKPLTETCRAPFEKYDCPTKCLRGRPKFEREKECGGGVVRECLEHNSDGQGICFERCLKKRNIWEYR